MNKLMIIALAAMALQAQFPVPGGGGGGGGVAGTGVAPYPVTVTAQTTLTVLATTHNQGTAPQPTCVSGAASPWKGGTCDYDVATNGDVTFTWSPAFTGKVFISGGGPIGATGPAGAGDVVGPASSTVGCLSFFGNTTGKLLAGSCPELFWDTVNKRLGIGTVVPGSSLSVAYTDTLSQNLVLATFRRTDAGGGGGSTILRTGDNNNTGDVELNSFANSTGIRYGTFGDLNFVNNYVAAAGAWGGINFVANGAIKMKITGGNNSGNLLLGTTTDLGAGVHAARSGTLGTFMAFDPTATTGTTKAIFRAGAGQSTNILEVQNNAGTAIASIGSTGSFTVPSVTNSTGLASGTYTPALTNTTNVSASTPRLSTYSRVGNTITVSGQFDIDPLLTATATEMEISLPVASNFTTVYQAGGNASATGVATSAAAGIEANVTNDTVSLKFICSFTTNQPMAFTFTYQVL